MRYLTVLLLATTALAADDFYVTPYDVDPAIEIDARLDDWENVPNAIVMNTAEHVTFGKEAWSGTDDLSATVRLAWRAGGVFIAAEVIDDRVQNPYVGFDMWKGDHVNLLLDFVPSTKPEQTRMGEGQAHIGISPGNFRPGDIDATAAEVVVFRPKGLPNEGARVASRRTDNGYVVEAFVPAAQLGIDALEMNKDANFEVAVSDSDGEPAHQDTMITGAPLAWEYVRARLQPMVFGDGNGKGQMPAREQALADSLAIPAGGRETIVFQAEAPPEGRAPFLFFRARIDTPNVGGSSANAMRITLNGKPLDRDTISNRPASSMLINGMELAFVGGGGKIRVNYAPDYDAVDRHTDYQLLDNVKACEYEFNVAALAAEGDNELVFENVSAAREDNPMRIVVGDVTWRVRTPEPEPTYAPAPTGPLTLFEPLAVAGRTYHTQSRDATLTVATGDRAFDIASRFSTPDGKWNTSSNAYFDHQRRVDEHDCWLIVSDTFTNRTEDNLPIMQEHTASIGQDVQGVWLAGMFSRTPRSRTARADNPSIYGQDGQAGIGMVALNDEFRVHVEQITADGAITLADRTLVVPPGETYTAQWLIVPTPQPDFWQFINTARQQMEVNFTLDLAFSFVFGDAATYEWSDEVLRNYVENKSTNFIARSFERTYKGRPAHGFAFQQVPLDHWRAFVTRMNETLSDDVLTAAYVHCYLDAHEDATELFADDVKIDAQGHQIDYGGRYSYLKAFIPTLENAYGRMFAHTLDILLDDVGVDGIYWDEFTTSRGEYIYNMWDRHSGDINPRTFALDRLKGSTALISRDFRAAMTRHIRQRGPLYINGAPHTRTLGEMNIPAFTETGSISNCTHMLLYSPIALGDHHTERKFTDAYRVMLRALDHGCLYAWYNMSIFPTHKTLVEHMYPFTPIELHEGYVIGKERILTNRSGLFGWGDASDFVVHVYDRDGKQTDEIAVPRILRDGKAYAEMRLPEGYAAAIVRKTP
jgi:hypothetical protein